eukprot:Rhum_TRINITY_DN150_c0_g1::Rhum_TRINITY_DN150_c0_g1_i1::g.471::m.471/K08582/CAPN15; calpain-15
MPKEQVKGKDGLFMEETGGILYFENNLRDKQYILTCQFTGDAKPHGSAKDKGGKIEVSVHPGERLPMAKGSDLAKQMKGKPAIKCGPCDKEWLKKQMAESDTIIEKEVKEVKQILQKSGVKKVTADATAKACADAGIKFLDVTFPPRRASLKPDWIKREVKEYPWKRPDVFLKGTSLKPALFVGEIEPNDIDQGALADCYLMGALSAVAEFERLVRSCFEQGQDPDLGLYRVSLCKNGWWQTVIVDDYLPCSGPKPAFARNRDEPNELWVSLVEKAYAKIHGSFAAIQTGGSAPALGDLTGCPYKTIEFTGDGSTCFNELLENDKNEFLQVLGTPGKNLMYVKEGSASAEEQKMWDDYQKVGLICEHSYSLITVFKTSKGDELCMIRNPWGNDQEWTGKWSDDDTDSWTAEMKKECGFTAADDGTFWMEFKDVKKYFSTVSINYCHGTWDQVRVAGNWEKGASDLMVEVKAKKNCRVWFGLHQKDIRGVKDGADAKYSNMTLCVATPDKKKMKQVLSMGTGKRDVYDMKTLEEGKTYYFYGQPKDEALTKSFVLSMLIEEKDFVDVEFKTAKGKRYGSPKEFIPDDWAKTEAQYQIKGQFSTNGTVVTRQGKQVTFKDAADLGLRTEQSNFKLTIAADRKKSEVDADDKVLYELVVNVKAGRKLAAKDDNGFSDPYCEVKLRGYDKATKKVLGSHRHPQKQVTTVKDATLNPEWNEKFSFLAAASDVVRVHCFDKDDVGKEALGRIDVHLLELKKKGLKEGGEVTDWYSVVGDPQDGEVSGDLQVSVKLVSISK